MNDNQTPIAALTSVKAVFQPSLAGLRLGSLIGAHVPLFVRPDFLEVN